MPSIVWTSLCLLFVISLSAVASAGMIGMHIALEVQVGLYGVGFMLAVFGWLLLATSTNHIAADITSPSHQ
jgi:hypothetical protein